jgi:hypothetical protein
MTANVDQYVTNLYANNQAGDIDPSQYIDAQTLASDLSSDYDSTGHYAYAAAEAAVAGIPGNLDNAMSITLENDAITVNGSIWTDWTPYESTSTSTATPTDDPATSAFETGQLYDPSNTSKLVLLSYEYAGDAWMPGSDVWVPDGSGGYSKDKSITDETAWSEAPSDAIQVGYGELTQPFTIESATNTETGESVSVVKTESKNHQTSDTTLTKEELNQLLDLRDEMKNQEATGGGGGFTFDQFSIGSIPGAGVLAIVAGGALWLFDQDD